MVSIRGYTAFVSICFCSVILDTVKGTRDSLSRFRKRIMRNAGHNTSLLRSLIALVGISKYLKVQNKYSYFLASFLSTVASFPILSFPSSLIFISFLIFFFSLSLHSNHILFRVTGSSNHGITILLRDK